MASYYNLKHLSESSLNSFAKEEVDDLITLSQYCEALGINDRVRFDPSLSFRLGYYTGLIFEAVFRGSSSEQEQAQLLSLSAGGRYDDMVKKINPGHQVPCVGFTINIEKIFQLLEKRDSLNLDCVCQMQTRVLVISEEGYLMERMKLCARLWDSNIEAEFFYEQNPKQDDQLHYCKVNDISHCVFVTNEGMQAKNIKTDDQYSNSDYDAVIEWLKSRIKDEDRPSVFKKQHA